MDTNSELNITKWQALKEALKKINDIVQTIDLSEQVCDPVTSDSEEDEVVRWPSHLVESDSDE